jgi:hypothetical protein
MNREIDYLEDITNILKKYSLNVSDILFHKINENYKNVLAHQNILEKISDVDKKYIYANRLLSADKGFRRSFKRLYSTINDITDYLTIEEFLVNNGYDMFDLEERLFYFKKQKEDFLEEYDYVNNHFKI